MSVSNRAHRGANLLADFDPELLQMIGSYCDAPLLLDLPSCSVQFRQLSKSNIIGGYVAARAAHNVALLRHGVVPTKKIALRRLRSFPSSTLGVYGAEWARAAVHEDFDVRKRALELLSACPILVTGPYYAKLRKEAYWQVQEKAENGFIFINVYRTILVQAEERQAEGRDDWCLWAMLAADDFPCIWKRCCALLVNQNNNRKLANSTNASRQ